MPKLGKSSHLLASCSANDEHLLKLTFLKVTWPFIENLLFRFSFSGGQSPVPRHQFSQTFLEPCYKSIQCAQKKEQERDRQQNYKHTWFPQNKSEEIINLQIYTIYLHF